MAESVRRITGTILSEVIELWLISLSSLPMKATTPSKSDHPGARRVEIRSRYVLLSDPRGRYSPFDMLAGAPSPQQIDNLLAASGDWQKPIRIN